MEPHDNVAGMLSKSKGQILRVAAAMHVLFALDHFNINEDNSNDAMDTITDNITDVIQNDAIVAAINFIDICCQQTAYIAGRNDIKEDIKLIKACK